MSLPLADLSPEPAGPAPELARVDGRVTCAHCGAAYRPELVQHACPVCRTPAPDAPTSRRAPLRDDDRLLLIVALATLANIVVLGILTVALLS